MRTESSPPSIRHLLTLGFFSEKESYKQKGSARASVFLYSILRLLIDPLREGLVLLMQSLLMEGLYNSGWRCVGVGSMQPFKPAFSAMTHKAGKLESLPHAARNGALFPANSVGVDTEAGCSVCFA